MRRHKSVMRETRKKEMYRDFIKQLAKTTLIVLSAFLIVLGGYYLYSEATTSEYFMISNYEITGNHLIKQSRVRELAAQGSYGENIFKANIRHVSNTISNDPWIEIAAVSRKIPDRLYVEIKERNPFAKIELPGGEKYLIDRKAFVIKKIDGPEYQVLPTILLSENSNFTVGRKGVAEGIRSGIDLIEKLYNLKKMNYTVDFTSVTKEEEDRYVLRTSYGDMRISLESLKENLQKLNIASKVIKREGLEVKAIDLTFDDQVILKIL